MTCERSGWTTYKIGSIAIYQISGDTLTYIIFVVVIETGSCQIWSDLTNYWLQCNWLLLYSMWHFNMEVLDSIKYCKITWAHNYYYFYTLVYCCCRYQFFQQCKADILSGTLPCPDEAMAIELAAYALQCKNTLTSYY